MFPRTTLASALLIAGLAAQNDYNFDKLTSGRLGSMLTLQASGAPASQIMLFLVSSTGGPTPLAAIDPLDPRSVQVGTDLLGLLSFTITSPTGGATYSLPLPNNPAISNVVFHWQTLTLGPGSPFFGQISNDIVTQTGLQDSGVPAPDVLVNARAFAASLVDRDNNGGQMWASTFAFIAPPIPSLATAGVS